MWGNLCRPLELDATSHGRIRRIMRLMRLARVVTLMVIVFGVSHANANTIGFSGAYAPANWTIVVDHGLVTTSGAPDYVDLVAGEICGSGSSPLCRFSRQQFLYSAFEYAVISFDWDFRSFDMDGAEWDPFVWFGGGQTGGSVGGGALCMGQGPPPPHLEGCHQTGRGSFLVQPGEIFGFHADSLDSAHNGSITRVSNFSATVVPEPTTMILFGSGLVVAALQRRRVQRGLRPTRRSAAR